MVPVVALAALVAQAFGRFSYALLLPAVQKDLAISYTLAGTLGTSNLIAYLLGSAAVSWAATRISLTLMIRIGLIGSVTGLFILWWSPNLAVLFVGMVLTGLAGAAIWIPGPGVAASLADPRRRGLVIGLVGTGIGIGFVAAGVIARAQIDSGWRSVYLTEALVGVVVLVAGWLFLHGRAEAVASRPSIAAIKTVPGWLPLVGVYASFGLSMSLFVNFLVARLEEDAGFTPEAAAVAFSVFGIASIFGGPIFGPLSDRIGRRATMGTGFAGMALAALLALVGVQPWPLAAAVVFGVAFAGVPTALAAHISDHVDPQGFGSAFGVITLSFGAGQILGPQLGGWLGDVTGAFTFGFFTSAVVALAGLAFALRVPATHH